MIDKLVYRLTDVLFTHDATNARLRSIKFWLFYATPQH